MLFVKSKLLIIIIATISSVLFLPNNNSKVFGSHVKLDEWRYDEVIDLTLVNNWKFDLVTDNITIIDHREKNWNQLGILSFSPFSSATFQPILFTNNIIECIITCEQTLPHISTCLECNFNAGLLSVTNNTRVKCTSIFTKDNQFVAKLNSCVLEIIVNVSENILANFVFWNFILYVIVFFCVIFIFRKYSISFDIYINSHLVRDSIKVEVIVCASILLFFFGMFIYENIFMWYMEIHWAALLSFVCLSVNVFVFAITCTECGKQLIEYLSNSSISHQQYNQVPQSDSEFENVEMHLP